MENCNKISYGFVGLFGILSVVVIAASWFFAAQADPSWVLGTNALSDMGVSDVELTKTMFNYGMCAIGGALLAIFGLLLTIKDRSFCGFVFGALVLLTGICLVAVGFVPVTDSMHNPIAIAFALFFLFAAIIVTICDAKDGHYFIAGVGATLILIGVFLAITTSFNTMEAGCAAVSIVFMLLQSLKYTFKKS